MAKNEAVQDALFAGADGCMEVAGNLMHNNGDWESAANYLSSAADLLRMYGEAEKNAERAAVLTAAGRVEQIGEGWGGGARSRGRRPSGAGRDRKSTRLNSSH